MRITYRLRESMGILLSGEPCTLTFWGEGRLHKYEGSCYRGVAHFSTLPYSIAPSDPSEYWITRIRKAA